MTPRELKILEKEYQEEINLFPIDSLEKQIAINQEEQDKFAIEFAEWGFKKRIDFFDSTEIGEMYTIDGFGSKYKMNELLELFKKEKGL